MKNELEIKPCPICGEDEAAVIYSSNCVTVEHRCNGAKNIIKLVRDTEDDAFQAWNQIAESAARPKTFNYWRVEVYVEGQDMAIIGYSKREMPFSDNDGDYLSFYQSASGIDFITIPLSRVIALKSYAVTE
ncbi:hypothetical protein [Xenorhabdus hominickii]|uniref:Uncharacterized protein n=1 Tax=Xenorhabdus hominickii TaxID=351679 RepID=A0A2G0Q2J0_XENHO|nr:hypothetical protein [Xenorhabdus hominickii]AOM39665.1 hypothetical protein A9255_03105 [Xenorhabdus hominickii]PHM53421.1 hypothetical protein Xhom_03419 [Xenorhabdus hominickii]